MEIVIWDGSIILVIAKKNEIANTFIEKNAFVQDLEKYNMGAFNFTLSNF